MTAIAAVAVVIPARDEEESIGSCLDSVRTALRRLPAAIETVLTVVLDRCVDSTPQRVDTLIAGWPGAVSLRVVATGGHRVGPALPGPAHIVAGSGVGALRDLGVRDALARLRPRPTRSIAFP